MSETRIFGFIKRDGTVNVHVQYRSKVHISFQSRLETRSTILDVFENRGSGLEIREEKGFDEFRVVFENLDQRQSRPQRSSLLPITAFMLPRGVSRRHTNVRFR